MKRIILTDDGCKTVMFQSNSEIEIATVYRALFNYHYFDRDIIVSVEEVEHEPKYKSIKSIYDVYELGITHLEILMQEGIQNNVIYPYSRDGKLIFISYNSTIDSFNYHSYVKVKDKITPSVDMITTNIIKGFKLLYPDM